MKEEKKGKRVLSIELDNEVKKVTITGVNAEEKWCRSASVSYHQLQENSN